MKYIEIKGIGFPNKGAELLLCAVLEQIKKRQLIACMEPYSPYSYKINYPVATKTRIYKWGINLLFPLNLLPDYVTDRLGFIKPRQVSLILDASGFAYGDDWSASLAESRILNEKKGAQIILLPQSLGPFTKKTSITVAKKLAKKAKLIYSREHVGQDQFEAVTGTKIKYCPDITFNLAVTQAAPTEKQGVLVIPNFQVYKREGEAYLNNLVFITEYLLKTNKKVDLLNHEGIKDQEICEKIKRRIAKKTKAKIQILNPPNGLEAKKQIQLSELVITSRYHGLISALSQQVPVACYGWSFKYNEALSRFSLPTYNLSKPNEQILKEICSEKYSNLFLSKEYQRELKSIKLEINQMWSNVFS